ncbi:MAG: M23 family metallopeptidase [Treponema sp.]|nr:M23 family metallopeptidase [Treponema sp.]
MPQYNEEFSELEKESDAELLAKAEASENQEQELKPLTYWTYRIRPGDMIGLIAEKYDVSQDTLISVNNIRASRLIQPGQYIKIPSEEGILYTVKKDGETPATISEKYEVDAARCAFVNKMGVDDELKAGSSIFVPGAEMDSITLSEINGDLFRKPLHTWYRLTSYFGWRPSPFTGRRSWHGGIDMACPRWTKIYAGMAGRVADTGYNNTYGNYVIINHMNGYKTLYGHMERIDCRPGQWVTTESVIGRVGSTGASTGPHLHFTVFKRGKMVNPLNLLG